MKSELEKNEELLSLLKAYHEDFSKDFPKKILLKIQDEKNQKSNELWILSIKRIVIPAAAVLVLMFGFTFYQKKTAQQSIISHTDLMNIKLENSLILSVYKQ